MQVSIKWLKDYIDFDWSAEELADRFTMAGVPVENVIRADEGLDKVVTGRIEKLTKHPDSDHLQICQMNVGEKELVQIITGAQNVAEGQVVPVAMIGAHLPNGLHIKKGKLRGLPSNGMLCSAGELHLDLTKLTEEEKDGIYILPPDTPVGVPAKDVLGLDDVVLEFELTANRGDCFSVIGLVREIAVLTGNKPKWPVIACKEDDEAKAADMVSVGIEARDLCDRFSARVIKNVKIGPSSFFFLARLSAFRASGAPSGRPVQISSFAFSIFSRVPRFSRCETPIIVMMPALGRAQRVRRSISPAWSMPISTTAYSVSSVRRNSVLGTPMSLFWLPSVLRVLPKAESTA